MVVRPQPNLCGNTSRVCVRYSQLILLGRGLAAAVCFVIGRRNRYRGLHEQANPDNSTTTPHIIGYGFFGLEFQEGIGRARISARRRRLSFQHFSAPDLSRAVDDPPHCISKLPGPTTPWTKQPARTAQTRRDLPKGGGRAKGAPRFSPYRSRLLQTRYRFRHMTSRRTKGARRRLRLKCPVRWYSAGAAADPRAAGFAYS